MKAEKIKTKSKYLSENSCTGKMKVQANDKKNQLMTNYSSNYNINKVYLFYCSKKHFLQRVSMEFI